ncbi:hypothetical protein EJB05_04045, partial [Eragrostis curvula]
MSGSRPVTLPQLTPSFSVTCTNRNLTVSEVVTRGLAAHMVPRLSHTAEQELMEVQSIVDTIELHVGDDVRNSPFIDHSGKLRSASIYKAMVHDEEHSCPFYMFAWKTPAPPKARFFAWLLIQERIQCRSNLYRKNIVESATCELCHNGEETADHLILRCPHSASSWSATGVQIPATATVTEIWKLPKPDHIPALHFDCYILLCCWQIWKHRNDVVFNDLQPFLSRLQMQCKEGAALWRCRLPSSGQSVVESWCLSFSPM